MLTVESLTYDRSWTVIIQGPRGRILIRDLVWMAADREDLVEIVYWEAWSVLEGCYHCCLSIPGKVELLES